VDSKHIAFFVEQAYGHIIPTLGITMELIRRKHRVSYAVSANFAPAITRSGARAMIFNPMDTRTSLCQLTAQQDGSHDAGPDNVELMNLDAILRQERTVDSVSQLEARFREDRPDLVIYDDCLDVAGKTLALRWGVPMIRHEPAMLSRKRMHRYRDSNDELILVSVPDFLNEDLDAFDARFKSIGFIPEGRREAAQAWEHSATTRSTIVVGPTTGQLPQITFCKLAFRAFGELPSNVVLSLPSELDPVSAIDPQDLAGLPRNFRVNRYSSNLDIMQHASLFVGQGGPGSTLEALYSGVPVLLVPISPAHDVVALRIAELGLGVRLHISDASPEKLRECAQALMANAEVLARVAEVQQSLRAHRGATLAADIIEERLCSPVASSTRTQS
jgi:UDP:flavonoid glycosyltransferase YjiC (YdhE family)